MNRVTQLRSIILKAKQCYYFGNSCFLTDAEYDSLEQELKKLSPDDEILKMVGCPVPPDSILEKANHTIQMISQDKVNTEEEFRKWYTDKVANKEYKKLHISLKGDGGSVAAYYKNGYLVTGVSRGDGYVGENITSNVMKFKGLPVYIESPDGPFSGSIRFEAILTKEDWEITGGKNPRNQGNGILGRKDGEQSELITAFAFEVFDEDVVFKTETEKSEFLESVGINVMPWTIVDSADGAIDFYNKTMSKRGVGNSGKIDFWIDGVVFKVDDLSTQDEIGLAPSGKYHKAQIAWKPDEEGTETILRDVVFSGGHDGGIYPNARFDPVEIGGTTISNALLNNWDEINRLDIAIGDTIFVVKANEIIPKIRRVVHRPVDREPIPEPTKCPFCGGNVGRKKTLSGAGANTMCFNQDCPAKQDRKLRNWFKKTDILGVGDSVREALQQQFNIVTVADIYRLGREITVEQLRELVTSSDTKLGHNADYIIEEIDKKRDLPLHIFLGSLGIEGLGRREVQIACEKAPTELGTLALWRSNKLLDKDFAIAINAPNKADKWADGLNKMSCVIDQLLENGVTVGDFVMESREESTGTTVCITGALPSGKKKAEYRESLTSVGLVLVDKVSKDLGYLVVSDPSKETGKSRNVRKYNAKGSSIQIIGEDELMELIAG